MVEKFDDERHFLFTAGEVDADEVDGASLGNAGTGDGSVGKVEVESAFQGLSGVDSRTDMVEALVAFPPVAGPDSQL